MTDLNHRVGRGDGDVGCMCESPGRRCVGDGVEGLVRAWGSAGPGESPGRWVVMVSCVWCESPGRCGVVPVLNHRVGVTWDALGRLRIFSNLSPGRWYVESVDV